MGRLSREQWGAVGNRICSPPQELLHCSGDGRKEERGWALLGLLQTLPAPSLPLSLCAPGVSRAEDAESNAKGSGMISTSNSILPSASSALEPHGNSPEVLILSSSSRLSRAHCPGLQAQPLCPTAGRRQGAWDGALPGMGSRGVRRKSCKCTLCHPRHGCSCPLWLH